MRVDLLAQQRLLLLAQKNATEFKRRLAEATARLEQQESNDRSHSVKSKNKIGSKRKSTVADEAQVDVAPEPDNSPSSPKKN